MNDSLKHKIFIETDCISEQTMFDYIDKKLSAKESHSVEKHLLHCELCSDALEGLELTSNRARIAAINQKVREYIAPRKETRLISFNYKLIVSIAASVLLLIGGIFFFNQFSKKDEMAEFKSENAVSFKSQPPPPPQDDEMIFDSTISNSPEVAKEENTSFPGKGRLDKMEEEAPPATAEGQGSVSESQSDSKTRIVTGEKAADNAGASYYSVTPTVENKKGTATAPIKSDNIAPKSELYQRAKDGNLAEQKNAGAAGGVADERDMELSESTVTTISKSTATSGISDSDDIGGDKVAKKSVKPIGLFRSESKEKRKTEREKEESPTESIAYAPQSIVNDDEKLVSAKVAESEPDQLQDELKSIDQMPEFMGGQDSLLKFIRKNFKYPANYKAESSNKKIDVNFIVDKDGKIKKAKIVKGINSELDKEALRVVNSMPKWKAGLNNGKPVSVNFDLPIILE
ncbi:MAG: TonB family protein [Bacteroidota bacterium]|nr:TonB family protein [Bacteroidota bacterium]